MFRRQEIILRNKRRNDEPLPSSLDFTPWFAGSVYSDFWTSGDARWTLNSGWLYLNYTDWNSDGSYLKYANLYGACDKVTIEYYVRRESGSVMWDQISYINMNGAAKTLSYFNGGATNASFLDIGYTYTGLTGSDMYIKAELQSGLQNLYVNGALHKTLNNAMTFPIFFYLFSGKNQIKFNRLVVTADRWVYQ
jgi:hypothetical protein